MKKISISILKFIAASLGPACIIYAVSIFEKYHSNGKDISDELFNVALINHGVTRYVTEEQNREFYFFLVLGGVVSLGMIAIIFFGGRKQDINNTGDS
ncbi:hypothetical protein [Acidovorax sp. sic0104]|uniref:hypothetical protein n=1 Tax=Acidovorax sp. sic0104 TaxID=2854784 RepID=UPI001C4676AB|nr:hypothetical protein [Acidovorax sp. sic0104]MBV7544642.1 hypothetical protein [Acidovorax sp. sic0104]